MLSVLLDNITDGTLLILFVVPVNAFQVNKRIPGKNVHFFALTVKFHSWKFWSLLTDKIWLHSILLTSCPFMSFPSWRFLRILKHHVNNYIFMSFFSRKWSVVGKNWFYTLSGFLINLVTVILNLNFRIFY